MMHGNIQEKRVPEITQAQRAAQLRAFVDATGFRGADIAPLRADASVRRFYRVEKGGRSAVLMEARPPMEDTRKYVGMREKFAAIGMTVPGIYDADHARGFVLMEDFGDIRYYELITQGREDTRGLYTLAVDALVHKHFADPAVALEGSVAYSDEYWLYRVEQFLLHYMPQVAGRTASETARAEFLGAFGEAIRAAHTLDDVLLHGDYGAQNLYYLPERGGVKALGLIDFQDLTDARGNMMGSPAFDLVFLLQDVRLSLPAGLEEEMRARFVQQAKIADENVFMGEYATIGAAQAAKCLGLFARLGHGEGRSEYLPFIPYCWRNLARNLAHPDLARVRGWFADNDFDIEKGPSLP